MAPPLCFVLTSLALTGGVERDAMKCLRAYGEQGRSLHVVAGFVRAGVREVLQDIPITWHPVYSLVRPPSWSQLLIYLQAKRIVAQLRGRFHDLSVISFEPNPLADYWVGGSPRALWEEAKQRGGFSRSFKPGLTLWQQWSEKQLCANARHILTYSEQAEQWFMQHGVASSRMTRVIIPTDLVRFSPAGLPLDARSEVLIIGVNPRLKGIDIALRAWQVVQQRFPALRLRIVCKGWKVAKLVKKSALNSVDISPFISTPEEYYRQARLVLMPSMFESWGNVPMEALACGVPVVVSQQTPSSMVVSGSLFGETFDRDGNRDDEKLVLAMCQQLSREDCADAMQLRHAHIQCFHQQYETTVGWLLAHV